MNKEKLEKSADNMINMLYDLTETARYSKTLEEFQEPLDIIDKTLASLKKMKELGIPIYSILQEEEKDNNNIEEEGVNDVDKSTNE